ncbi:MBL fold metallo-hydrolase [Sulfurimonas sp. HSL-1716]|uniref:MBL fold metallo-hydrolase n=1 Tax=Hydrocurvibacter sulfurireducens TaxID=3131937 RepID=UPI0031F910BE
MSYGLIDSNKNKNIECDGNILLFDSPDHKIYWMGIEEETAFRCNVYLIQDGDEYLLVDPGSRIYHEELRRRVADIIEPEKVTGLILSHQDPDVAASMVDWLGVNPRMLIYTSTRTNVLLPYHGKKEYDFYNISLQNEYRFKSGRTLKFIESPFLHFPGAFTTLDITSHMLFSGDIWAALDTDWNLVVNDFEAHKSNMDLFHIDYMASNIASRGYAKKIENEHIEAILPQHGSIISNKNISDAMEYLKNLKCGLDIIYSELH